MAAPRRPKSTGTDALRALTAQAHRQGQSGAARELKRSASQTSSDTSPPATAETSEEIPSGQESHTPGEEQSVPERGSAAAAAEHERVQVDGAARASVDGGGKVHVYSTRVGVGERAPATSFVDVRRSVSYTVRIAEPLAEQITQWERQARRINRRVNVSTLAHAAFHDFPTELDELYDLAGLLPRQLYDQGAYTLMVRLPAQVKETMQDAAFELKVTRSLDVVLWHCASAALARQLESEGLELSW